MASLILDDAELDRIQTDLVALMTGKELDPAAAEQLVRDAMRLLADLETLAHRARQAMLCLDGRAHTADDPP